MQLTQVLNAQKKVHNKRESVLQLKLLGAGPWGHGSKPAVRLIFDPEVRRELSPYPWSGRREQPPCPDSSNPFGGKTVCVNREWASPKDTCDIGWCDRIAVSREEQMLWSTCGCSQGKRCDGTYNTYRWRANTRKWARTVRDWGPRLGENRGGRVGKLDSTSSLRLDKDPRWAREVGNVRLYSCRSSLCWRVIHALRACADLGCWRQGVAWQQSPVRCLLPCIRALREKEDFQLFHFVQPLKMVHSTRRTVCSGTSFH